MADYTDLINRASNIKKATEEGSITAEAVGGLMKDHIEATQAADSKATTHQAAFKGVTTIPTATQVGLQFAKFNGTNENTGISGATTSQAGVMTASQVQTLNNAAKAADLTAEISRAKTAEETNATAISNEVTRAKAVENASVKKVEASRNAEMVTFVTIANDGSTSGTIGIPAASSDGAGVMSASQATQLETNTSDIAENKENISDLAQKVSGIEVEIGEVTFEKQSEKGKLNTIQQHVSLKAGKTYTIKASLSEDAGANTAIFVYSQDKTKTFANFTINSGKTEGSKTFLMPEDADAMIIYSAYVATAEPIVTVTVNESDSLTNQISQNAKDIATFATYGLTGDKGIDSWLKGVFICNCEDTETTSVELVSYSYFPANGVAVGLKINGSYSQSVYAGNYGIKNGFLFLVDIDVEKAKEYIGESVSKSCSYDIPLYSYDDRTFGIERQLTRYIKSAWIDSTKVAYKNFIVTKYGDSGIKVNARTIDNTSVDIATTTYDDGICILTDTSSNVIGHIIFDKEVETLATNSYIGILNVDRCKDKLVSEQTIDDEVTEGSSNAVKSSGVYAAIQAINPQAQRAQVITIAASDADDKVKAGAAYVCTGANDEVIINKAISELDCEQGAEIHLSGGNFKIASPIVIDRDGIMLTGEGYGVFDYGGTMITTTNMCNGIELGHSHSNDWQVFTKQPTSWKTYVCESFDFKAGTTYTIKVRFATAEDAQSQVMLVESSSSTTKLSDSINMVFPASQLEYDYQYTPTEDHDGAAILFSDSLGSVKPQVTVSIREKIDGTNVPNIHVHMRNFALHGAYNATFGADLEGGTDSAGIFCKQGFDASSIENVSIYGFKVGIYLLSPDDVLDGIYSDLSTFINLSIQYCGCCIIANSAMVTTIDSCCLADGTGVTTVFDDGKNYNCSGIYMAGGRNCIHDNYLVTCDNGYRSKTLPEGYTLPNVYAVVLEGKHSLFHHNYVERLRGGAVKIMPGAMNNIIDGNTIFDYGQDLIEGFQSGLKLEQGYLRNHLLDGNMCYIHDNRIGQNLEATESSSTVGYQYGVDGNVAKYLVVKNNNYYNVPNIHNGNVGTVSTHTVSGEVEWTDFS